MPAEKLKIHFIGVGGIGVSALAKYYLAQNHEISGSDLAFSENIKELKKLGVKIFIGPHDSKNINQKIKRVIYSPAVKKNNPELKKAKKLGINCQSYPKALGELTKKHFTIAISGTHGKSTTCAMVALILTKAGFDPTVIVGTKLKEFGNNNCRIGKSKYLVIEADEHFASFLNYQPKIIVLTNIEKDHLDFYKNLENILKAYKKYISQLSENGVLITNQEDKNIKKILKGNKNKNYFFSSKTKGASHLKKILKIPGKHNVYNALAALTTARVLGISDKISFKALSAYKGSWRRFEMFNVKLPKRKDGKERKITLISDYAHHPTEVNVTLQALREKYPKKNIWCVFQPHQYQRTYYLFKDFVSVLKKAPVDKLIVTDIYDVAGREEKEIKNKVSSEKLAKAVKKNREITHIETPKKASDYLKNNLKGGEVLIVMGAGDIYQLTEKIST